MIFNCVIFRARAQSGRFIWFVARRTISVAIISKIFRAVRAAQCFRNSASPSATLIIAWRKRARKSLGLASAITASAAAFNSNMGSISMTLGAGVTFLCTALNLRLGLWLPHPATNKDGAPSFMPGLLFFREMFGLTNSGLHPRTSKPVGRYVHLSDGAHLKISASTNRTAQLPLHHRLRLRSRFAGRVRRFWKRGPTHSRRFRRRNRH